MIEENPPAPFGQSIAGHHSRVIRPEFTGSAAEYFRIWIVNLLFTLITLGIFSAWAKVRKKKYFYGNTWLDGDTFDYFAKPESILKGRILAVAALAIYALTGEVYPDTDYLFWLLGLALLPWLAVRALTFNARNTAWRGLRFDFTGSAGGAAKQFLGRLVVLVLSLGLALPWFMARVKAYVLRHHAFGTSQFQCAISAKGYYGIYLRAFCIMLPSGILLAALSALLIPARSYVPAPIAWALPGMFGYGAYAVAHAYIQARSGNLAWGGTTLGGEPVPQVRFVSTLGALALAKLYLSNLLAIGCSAGLMIPWAVVRTYRYRLQQFALLVEYEVVHEANPAMAHVGAAGQEFGDLLNLDVGI